MKTKFENLNEKGFLSFQIKEAKLNETNQSIIVSGYASTMTKDRDGDIVISSTIDTSDYDKNPIVLWQHDHRQPIGKTLSYEKRDNGLYVECEIFKDIHNEAYQAIKNGVTKTFSIGFIGKDGYWDDESDTFFFTKTSLLEISVVSVPANQDATFEVAQTCENGQCMLAQKSFSATHKEIIDIAHKQINTEEIKLEELIKTLQELIATQKEFISLQTKQEEQEVIAKEPETLESKTEEVEETKEAEVEVKEEKGWPDMDKLDITKENFDEMLKLSETLQTKLNKFLELELNK
jgi:HK97 family phage prohead protease